MTEGLTREGKQEVEDYYNGRKLLFALGKVKRILAKRLIFRHIKDSLFLLSS
jgi:hypothetical protein